MSSVSVRAVPGSSVVVSSKDLSLDASTLSFRIDQSGDTSALLGHNLSLNITCESSGPGGLPYLRISIEGQGQSTQLAANNSMPSIDTSTTKDVLQWPTMLDTMTVDPQSYHGMFIPDMSSDSNLLSNLLPHQLSDSSYASHLSQQLFEFDWSSFRSTTHPSTPDSLDCLPQLMRPDAQLKNRASSAMHSTFVSEENPLPSPSSSSLSLDTNPDEMDIQSESESEASNDPYSPEDDSHSNDSSRQFPCRREGCTSRFSREYTRRLHEKTHKPSNPRVFYCSIPGCTVKTSRRHDLLRHEVRKHGKKSEWQCEFCQTFFSSAKTQDRHTCSKKTIQTTKQGASTTCWKLPRHIPDA